MKRYLQPVRGGQTLPLAGGQSTQVFLSHPHSNSSLAFLCPIGLEVQVLRNVGPTPKNPANVEINPHNISHPSTLEEAGYQVSGLLDYIFKKKKKKTRENKQHTQKVGKPGREGRIPSRSWRLPNLSHQISPVPSLHCAPCERLFCDDLRCICTQPLLCDCSALRNPYTPRPDDWSCQRIELRGPQLSM